MIPDHSTRPPPLAIGDRATTTTATTTTTTRRGGLTVVFVRCPLWGVRVRVVRFRGELRGVGLDAPDVQGARRSNRVNKHGGVDLRKGKTGR